MLPEHLDAFFAASAGAAAALLGLLFVAISISPERVFGETSAAQAVATHALVSLANALFVSFAALISPVALGWVGAGMAALGLLSAAGLAWTLLYMELNPRLVRRRVLLVAAAFVVYALEAWFAAGLLIDVRSPAPAYGLACTLLGVYAVGILRAYAVLGARVSALRDWLGPRRFTEEPRAAVPAAPPAETR